jgi:hypothetical protein
MLFHTPPKSKQNIYLIPYNTSEKITIPKDTIIIKPATRNVNRQNVKEVIFKGNRVLIIGINAFHSYTGLKKIDIPESVEFIMNGAFSECTSLESVTFKGNKITTIGKNAFKNCSSLMTLTIPVSVISIGEYAFQGCTLLTDETKANINSIKQAALDTEPHVGGSRKIRKSTKKKKTKSTKRKKMKSTKKKKMKSTKKKKKKNKSTKKKKRTRKSKIK